MTYSLYNNKILRIAVAVLLALILCIVPIEHKMLEAHASFAAVAALSVICAALVSMGFMFGRAFLSNEIDAQFAKYSRAKTAESLHLLAEDIYNNCPGISAAIASCFPNGSFTWNTARHIVPMSVELYQIIKKYIISKYGDDAKEIEYGINQSFGYLGNSFMIGDYLFTEFDGSLNHPGYGFITLGSNSFTWKFIYVNTKR